MSSKPDAENSGHEIGGTAPTRSGNAVLTVGGIVLIAALLAAGTLPRLKQQSALAAEAHDSHAAPTVLTVTLHQAPDDALDLPGDVQAIETTVISARSSGYLSRRLVDIGSRVKTGDLLAEVESPEVAQQVAQAQAQADKSKAVVRQSTSDEDRAAASSRQAQSEIARQQAAVLTAKAEEARAKAQVEASRANELSVSARLDTAKSTLEARQADLQKARVQEDLAQKTYMRWQTLAKQGAISQLDLDQHRADRDATHAAVVSGEAQVRSAKSDVQAAQHALAGSKADTAATEAAVAAAGQTVAAASIGVDSSRASAAAAKAAVSSSKSLVSANNADLAASKANALHFAALQAFSKISAPFDGVITARNVEVGSLVNAGGAADNSAAPRAGLFGIARTDTLRIMVSIPQSSLQAVTEGQSADVSIQQLPGQVFKGSVYRLAGALDTTTRTRLAEVHVPNPAGILLPGMYARVRFEGSKTHSSLRIASNTLVVNAEGTRVAIVTPESKIHFVPVKIGRDYGTELEIREGLKGGEKLVTAPGDDLKEGVSVKATDAPPPPKP